MNRHQKIVILGGGESGTGSAVLAKKKGFETFLSDAGTINKAYKKLLDAHHIEYEEHMHTESKILDAYEVIKSPGIPDSVPVIQKIKQRGIPVIAEIEFAARYTDAKMLCVTGSNGKTTTTLLLYHICKKAGLNVGLAGNVGQSFALQVAEKNYDHYVLEISSFQLDDMKKFKADIAIITNITPDHLDRYDNNFQSYINSKFRITNNQTSKDYLVYCADDKATVNEIERREIAATMASFTLKNVPATTGAWVEDKKIIIDIHKKQFTMYLETLALQGKHNTYNSMAAGIAAKLSGIHDEFIRASLSDFQNIEHRLEFVANVHGVEFINDSKATNVNSTWFALECQNKPIIWIVGGLDKGNDYSLLFELVKEKVKAIICLGVDNTPILKAFSDKIDDIVETNDMVDAVQQAFRFSKKEDTVLLSPACASFDLFNNYEERGRKFKNAVKNL